MKSDSYLGIKKINKMFARDEEFVDHPSLKDAFYKTRIRNIQFLNIAAPFSVSYEITYLCNYSCLFCYNPWRKNIVTNQAKCPLSFGEKLKIIKILSNIRIFTLTLTGGEPLLDSNLDKIIATAIDYGMDIRLVTNGSLLTATRVRSLNRAGLKKVFISLHHRIPKINDYLTNALNSHSKTLKGAQIALEVFGDKGVVLTMVVSSYNYSSVFETAAFLFSLGFKRFSCCVPVACGKGSLNDNFLLNKDQFQMVYQQLVATHKKFHMDVGISGGFPLCLLPKIDALTVAMIRNYCDAGLTQLTIDPVGNIRPCVCYEVVLGNILHDDIIHIWNNSKFLKNLRGFNHIPSSCKNCNLVGLCKGGCRASAMSFYGKLDAIDPLLRSSGRTKNVNYTEPES